MTIDLTGKNFGRLTVIGKIGKNNHGDYVWKCKCLCGNETYVTTGNLNCHTRSCGCLEKETRAMFGTRSKKTHKETGSRLYKCWLGIKTRCFNQKDKSYEDYGKRGITMCAEWKDSYESFRDWARKNGYTNELTIERIDVNGNYEPNNCTWVTKAQQQRNKRNNKYYTFQGKTQLIPAWAKEFGVTDSMIRSRIQKGQEPEKVLMFFSKRQENYL